MDHLNPDTGSIKTVPVRMTGRRLNKNNLALFYGTLTSQSETYTNYATSSDNMAAMPSDAF